MTSAFNVFLPRPDAPAVASRRTSNRARTGGNLLGIILGMVCCSLIGSLPADGADLASAKEHQIKAAFVYNFLKFVDWPATRFETTNSPVVIGVVGDLPITAALESTVKGRSINGREIVVKSVETADAAKGSHLLFLPAGENRRTGELLGALAGTSVLTVGESDTFARDGGMINLLLEGDKVRFEINNEAAKKAGLKISSQLLKLARPARQ